MQRFYWRMVFLHNARRLSTLLLVLVLLVINATLYVSMNVIISLLMMTVVLALSSYRTMAKTLRLLQYRRRIFGLLTVAAAALIVVPGCLCIGLTLASLLLGAFFFPSARVLELSETEEYGARMLLQPDIILNKTKPLYLFKYFNINLIKNTARWRKHYPRRLSPPQQSR